MARREAEEKTEIVETINRIGQRLTAQTELTPLVQAFTDEATQADRRAVRRVLLQRRRRAGESYTLYAISGVPRAAFEQFPLPRNTDALRARPSGARASSASTT